MARTRSGLDSVARGKCQFDEEAQSQIDSGILSLSHHHLLAFSGPTDASKPLGTKPWVGRKARWGAAKNGDCHGLIMMSDAGSIRIRELGRGIRISLRARRETFSLERQSSHSCRAHGVPDCARAMLALYGG